MKSIIETNLNLSNLQNLYAGIYTARHDIEWNKSDRQTMHGRKSHLEEVDAIKNFLNQEIGIIEGQMPVTMWNLLDESGKERYLSWGDGRYNDIITHYEYVQNCIAI